MNSRTTRRWVLACTMMAILGMPRAGHAQEATVTGTVTDTTGGVLPGVTIKGVNDASGNSFETVTDARGAYRLAVRIGAYQITATLAGPLLVCSATSAIKFPWLIPLGAR